MGVATRKASVVATPTRPAFGCAQPGTWVTILTGDMGNTFLVLFRSVVAAAAAQRIMRFWQVRSAVTPAGMPQLPPELARPGKTTSR